MSHFVSHKAEDFDSLHQQLLQRTTGDDDAQDAFDASQLSDAADESSHHAEHNSSHPPAHVISPALAARRRPDLSRPVSGASSPRTPSYSRANSPGPGSDAPATASSSSSFRKPKGSERKLSDPDELLTARARNSTVGRPPSIASIASSSGEHAASSSSGGAHAEHEGRDVLSGLEGSSSVSRRGGLRSSLTARKGREEHKGVSFSDSRYARPGESSSSSRERGGRRAQRRQNSEVDTPAHDVATTARHEPAFVPQPYGRSAGMISKEELPPRKLGTWDGVFMPVSLNILGLILFLRFGFILGQTGLLGALFLLLISYGIDALTAMSVSAISTNGQVRGGGAYYLISRSLGPEFGGSIGLVFFLGQAMNAAMNVLGFVESLTDAFGESREGFLPEGPWWSFSYGSLVLVLSTLVCLVGSKLFARASLALAVILGVAIVSVPISSLVVSPFIDTERGVYYTGWSLETFKGNLMPNFTSGAAGSSTGSQKETWNTVFGVLFPAVTGILAGASMSGDLRKPSKSIPKGTNWSLVFTFAVYFISFIVFAGTISRESFYLDVGIVSDVAMSPEIITFGVLASCAFSALMGVMACGKVLQAIARDNLLPLLDMFAQGTEVSDTPTYAVFATYLLCQAVLLVDSVNLIAQLVTMTSLLTFGTLSFATLALKAGGAPSFRPSFRYFNIWTATGGTVTSFAAMFFTDSLAASACVVLAVLLFTAISFFCPPKPWGDVTRNLSYHVVRKYLLRLDERKSHVKYWRPQILLLANNPRTDWNLIIFCNSLKKGALYVLGHVLKGDFSECLGELRKQQIAWLKLVDISGIKSFVDVIIARDEREGARNLILSCGLGGMRPNVVVMGFPTAAQGARRAAKRGLKFSTASTTGSFRSDGSEITIRAPGDVDFPEPQPDSVVDVKILPTDVGRRETPILPTTFVGIMEDTLALNKALAIAYGFESMSILSAPSARTKDSTSEEKRYLDLWPIQIQSPDSDPSHAWDTYTMVLQLGTILSLTGTWKGHQLRVSVFVEHESEVEDERKRVGGLLEHLRVPATLRVFHLSSGSITSYQAIVLGKQPVPPSVEIALGGDPWWEALKQLRRDEEKRRAAWAKRRMASLTQPVSVSSPALGTVDADAPPPPGRKQTKREQKLLGVSLPAEHLAFYKRNMRIGLAHPRARVAQEDSEAESVEWSESEDEGSDLSDELARLGFDDTDWLGAAGGARNGGMKRSRTFSAGGSSAAASRGRSGRRYSLGGSAGLPDDPGQSLLSAPSSYPDEGYGSLSSTPIARPVPGLNGAGIAWPTAAPVRESNESSSDDQSGTLRPSDRARLQEQLAGRRVSAASSELASDAEDGVGDVDPRLDERRALAQAQARHVAEAHSRGDDGRHSISKAKGRAKRSSRLQDPLAQEVENEGSEVTFVSFNVLPNKAQYLILNELIRINSAASTSVVLTALPAPEPGTSDDESKTLRYLEQLESLFAGGPPVLGVHAKQLTMTSAL